MTSIIELSGSDGTRVLSSEVTGLDTPVLFVPIDPTVLTIQQKQVLEMRVSKTDCRPILLLKIRQL